MSRVFVVTLIVLALVPTLSTAYTESINETFYPGDTLDFFEYPEGYPPLRVTGEHNTSQTPVVTYSGANTTVVYNGSELGTDQTIDTETGIVSFNVTCGNCSPTVGAQLQFTEDPVRINTIRYEDQPLTAETPITTCQDITSSGTYVLQNDVSTTSSCFNITDPHVLLDLGGFEIDGGSADTNIVGVHVPFDAFEERGNITVRDGNITGFGTGILVETGSSFYTNNLFVNPEDDAMKGGTVRGLDLDVIGAELNVSTAPSYAGKADVEVAHIENAVNTVIRGLSATTGHTFLNIVDSTDSVFEDMDVSGVDTVVVNQESGTNTTFKNITIDNTAAGTVFRSSATQSTIEDMNLTTSTGNGLQLLDASFAVFNSTIDASSSPADDILLDENTGETELNVTNVSYTTKTLGTGTFREYWWYQANVTDGGGAVNGATVNLTSTTHNDIFLTTDTSGLTPIAAAVAEESIDGVASSVAVYNVSAGEGGRLNTTTYDADAQENTVQHLTLSASNTPPTHNQPSIYASDTPLNTTAANITAEAKNVSDPENDNLTVIFDWRANNNSIHVLNLPFDAETDEVVADYTKNPRIDAALGGSGDTNEPTRTTNCAVGACYDFNGAGDYIEVSDDTALDLDNTLSFAAWVNMDTLPSGNEYQVLQRTGSYGVFMSTTNGCPTLEINSAFLTQYSSTGCNITAGTWNHIAVTANSSESRFYINGEHYDTRGGISTPSTGSKPISIGRRSSGSQEYDGRIDQFILSDRTLSEAYIKQLYNEQNRSQTEQVNTSTLPSQETTAGDNISAAVTPVDTEKGTTKTTNAISINEPPFEPVLTASTPENNTVDELSVGTQNETVAVTWNKNNATIGTIQAVFDNNDTTDYDGFDDNGTVIQQENSPTWTPNGYIGGAYNFTGNGSIDFGQPEELANNESAFTISFWIKPDTSITNWMNVLGNTQDYNGDGFSVQIREPTSSLADTQLLTTLGGDTMTAYGYNSGEWNHIAFVYTGITGQMASYINGDFMTAETANPSSTAPSNNFLVGDINNTAASDVNYQGLFDELIIVQGVLKATEIKNIYDLQSQGKKWENLSFTSTVRGDRFTATTHTENTTTESNEVLIRGGAFTGNTTAGTLGATSINLTVNTTNLTVNNYTFRVTGPENRTTTKTSSTHTFTGLQAGKYLAETTVNADEGNYPVYPRNITLNYAPTINSVTYTTNSTHLAAGQSLQPIVNYTDPENDSVELTFLWDIDGSVLPVVHNIPFNDKRDVRWTGTYQSYSPYSGSYWLRPGDGVDPYLPKWVDGKVGRAIQFDGENDYARFLHQNYIDTDRLYTIMFWIKTNQSDATLFQDQRAVGTGDAPKGRLQGGQICFAPVGGSGSCTGPTINDGEWHHVALGRDGGTGYVYIDGEFAGTTSGGGNYIDGNAGYFVIGTSYDRSETHFNGSLDQFRTLFGERIDGPTAKAIYESESQGLLYLEPGRVTQGSTIFTDVTPADRYQQGPTFQAPNVVPIDPVPNTTGFNGTTTNFSAETDLSKVTNTTIEVAKHGSINWINNLNVRGTPFNQGVNISDNFISVDTTILGPQYNSTAKITLNNITGSAPYTIYRNEDICPQSICSNITANQSNVTFTTTQLSNFSIQGTTPTDAYIGAHLQEPISEHWPNLQLYYRFENNAIDSSDNGRNGTIQGNNPINTYGRIGQAARFLGDENQTLNDSIIDTEYSPNSLTAFTITTWVKATNNQTIITDHYEGVQNETISLTPNTFIINPSTGTTNRQAVSFDIGNRSKWHHVAAAWNGTHSQVYIDGTLTNTTSAPDAPRSTTQNLTVGAGKSDVNTDGTFNELNGSLDELTFFDTALTSEDIEEMYNATRGAKTYTDNALVATPVNETNSSTTPSYIYEWNQNSQGITVLHMPFDINVTTNVTGAVKDYSDSGNNGTLGGGTSVNSPSWTPSGIKGGAFNFTGNGDSDLIQLGQSPIMRGTQTLEAWVKPTSLSTESSSKFILTYSDTTSGNAIQVLYIASNQFRFGHGCEPNYKQLDGPTVSTDQWYHLVGTVNEDTNTVRFFVNGDEVDSDSNCGSPYPDDITNHKWAIGNRETVDLGFEGLIDEVRIYNRSLSAEQVKAIYNNGTPLYNHMQSQETKPGETWDAEIYATNTTNITQEQVTGTVTIYSDVNDSCVPNQGCETGTCVDTSFEGTISNSVCCATADSCVAGSTCYDDGEGLNGSTCTAGVWIADTGRYEIRYNNNVAVFDTYGSAAITGTLTEQCTASPPSNAWSIQDQAGNTNTYISTMGDLCIAGNLTERNLTMPCTATNCVEIQNTAGAPQTRIYTDGNISISGDFASNATLT